MIKKLFTLLNLLLYKKIIIFLFVASNTAMADEYATLKGDVISVEQQPVVIYLEPLSRTKPNINPLKKHRSIISNNNNFEPAFQVVQKGSILEIKNNDPIFHNTHVSENNMTLFNVATPSTNKTVKKIIPRTGIFDVACDLHPWMTARLAVIASSYYTVLEKPGKFQINNIIPGEYQVHKLQAKKDEVITFIRLTANSYKHISF